MGFLILGVIFTLAGGLVLWNLVNCVAPQFQHGTVVAVVVVFALLSIACLIGFFADRYYAWKIRKIRKGTHTKS